MERYMFKCVLLYMGMAAILLNVANTFEQIINILSTKGPMWNQVKIGRAL